MSTSALVQGFICGFFKSIHIFHVLHIPLLKFFLCEFYIKSHGKHPIWIKGEICQIKTNISINKQTIEVSRKQEFENSLKMLRINVHMYEPNKYWVNISAAHTAETQRGHRSTAPSVISCKRQQNRISALCLVTQSNGL